MFDSVISSDLVPFIDSHFRTIPDREHRALAGLSMGGGQAIRIGLNHLNQFAYLGAFSPALCITDTAKDYDGILADPAKANPQLRLLWIGVGSDDFLLAPVKGSHQALEKVGSNTCGSRVLVPTFGQCGKSTLPILRRGCFSEAPGLLNAQRD